jgi:Methyltransferase domain
MKRFWDTVIEPILEATRPKSMLEIGSDKGINTRNLLAFCERTDAVLHVVDPVPKYDVSAWQEQYGERFVFYRALSLEAIPLLDRFDLVLIDGDHNWYTVFNELKLIEKRCAELSQLFPLVMLHDICWPYGRRDLYYDPDTIPGAYRKPHALRGSRPGIKELLEEGGLNRQLYKAVYEGGPRNGVLTAVEDFLEEAEQRLQLRKIPGFHGLGILVPPHLRENMELVKILEVWDLPPLVSWHIERIEGAWLEAELQRQELSARLKQLKDRQDKKADNLRTKQTEMTDLRRRLKRMRRRLSETERRLSIATEEKDRPSKDAE